MARISFSALVEEIIGKMAGSVFQDSYGGFQVRTRVTPKNPQSTFQQLRRGEFGYLSSSWRGLTSVERQTFIDNAASPGGGLNLFLESNVNLSLLSLPVITTYIPTGAVDDFTTEITEVTPTAFKIRATGSPTSVPLGNMLLIYATGLRRQSQIFTNPSMFSPITAFPQTFPLSSEVDILAAYQTRFGQITADKRLCIKSVLIDTTNGKRGNESIVCANTEDVAKFVKIFTDVTPVAHSSAGPIDAYTFSMPANTLNQNGDCLRLSLQGEASGGGVNCSAFLVFNGTAFAGGAVVAAIPWYMEGVCQRIDSDTIRCSGSFFSRSNADQSDGFDISGVDFTTPIDIVFRLTRAAGTITALCAYVNKELV